MKPLYKFCSVSAMIYYKLFFKLEIDGLNDFDHNKNYVICANHSNLQDPILLGAVMPLEARFMGKKELFDNKPVGWFISKLGVFPVDRDANDLKAIKTALSVLKSNQNLALFPEGTRNSGFEPLPVKSGIAMLAIKTKTLVLPITIDTTYKFFKPMRIVFNKPIDLSEYYDQKLDSETVDSISKDIMAGIYDKMKYLKLNS